MRYFTILRRYAERRNLDPYRNDSINEDMFHCSTEDHEGERRILGKQECELIRAEQIGGLNEKPVAEMLSEMEEEANVRAYQHRSLLGSMKSEAGKDAESEPGSEGFLFDRPWKST